MTDLSTTPPATAETPLDTVRQTLRAGGSHRVEIRDDLEPDAVAFIINQVATDLELECLHAEVGDGEIVFSLRLEELAATPVEAEPEGEREINLIEALRHLRIKAEAAGLGVRLLGIPRELSLRLVGERAAELRTSLPMQYISALRDERNVRQLFVLDDTPVVAIPMVAPMLCAWYGTNKGTTLSAVEEHPAYPGLPFSRRIADTEPNRLPNFGRNALKAAMTITTKNATDLWVPAVPFMPAAPPPPDPAAPPPPPKTDDEFFAEVQSGLLSHKDEILETIRSDGKYAIGLGRGPAMAERVKFLLEDTLNVLVTVTEPDDKGFATLVLTQRLLVS